MATKAGIITLARHGEPALARDVMLTAREYGDFWGQYEIGGLKADQDPPPDLLEWAKAADVVFVSTRRRSLESARILIGADPILEDVRLIEAPLPPPPWPGFIRMSPKLWGFWARFWWWWFNYCPPGVETRDQAIARARVMLGDITAQAESGKNVLVVAHGFFNFMLSMELKRQGWKRIEGKGFKYWSTRRFVRP